MIPLNGKSKNNYINELIYKAETSHRYRRKTWLPKGIARRVGGGPCRGEIN